MPTLSENKNSKDLEKKIISTLIFYKILNVPCLTIFEIYRYLINDGRGANMIEIEKTLADSSVIKSQNGFYWTDAPVINTSTDCFKRRMENTKTSAAKIKKAKKIALLLSIIPWIKSIGISGSVSMNGAKPESDIDFFIISYKNRIWLTRLLTVILTQLIGQRRHKNMIKNRICLNIYIADENTKYPIENMANSQMILRTLPIHNKDIFKKFLFANRDWMGAHINNFDKNIFIKKEGNNDLSKKSYKNLDRIENLLSGIFSDRIFRKTLDAKPPYLVMNSKALLFHYPRSKNVEATEKHDQITSQLI